MLVAVTVDVEDPDQHRHESADAVTAILAALGQSGIRATFFVQGRWLAANPALASTMAADGHLIGNHSYFHADTRLLTAKGLREDVTRGHKEIEDALGIDARPWYRLPYGAGSESRAIRRRLRRLGYQHVGWDVDVKDFALSDPDTLVPKVADALAQRERLGATHSIVLLHSWTAVTSRSMPDLCRFLVEGCQGTVTVDQVPGRGAVEPRSALKRRSQALASRTRAVVTEST
jgi:peptidoglycan/xylan/chitin deacetylase (PgdA/CDA1 family)